MNITQKIEIIAKDVMYKIGEGHSENVYHNAMEIGLRKCGIEYDTEVSIPIMYENTQCGLGRIDLLVENEIIVELKALKSSIGKHEICQAKKYLSFTNYNKAVVINFKQSGNSEDKIEFELVN